MSIPPLFTLLEQLNSQAKGIMAQLPTELLSLLAGGRRAVTAVPGRIINVNVGPQTATANATAHAGRVMPQALLPAVPGAMSPQRVHGVGVQGGGGYGYQYSGYHGGYVPPQWAMAGTNYRDPGPGVPLWQRLFSDPRGAVHLAIQNPDPNVDPGAGYDVGPYTPGAGQQYGPMGPTAFMTPGELNGWPSAPSTQTWNNGGPVGSNQMPPGSWEEIPNQSSFVAPGYHESIDPAGNARLVPDGVKAPWEQPATYDPKQLDSVLFGNGDLLWGPGSMSSPAQPGLTLLTDPSGLQYYLEDAAPPLTAKDYSNNNRPTVDYQTGINRDSAWTMHAFMQPNGQPTAFAPDGNPYTFNYYPMTGPPAPNSLEYGQSVNDPFAPR